MESIVLYALIFNILIYQIISKSRTSANGRKYCCKAKRNFSNDSAISRRCKASAICSKYQNKIILFRARFRRITGNLFDAIVERFNLYNYFRNRYEQEIRMQSVLNLRIN